MRPSWPEGGRAAADRWVQDIASCRATLRQGSRSFWAASLVLPKRVRDPATALYAFCREADDAIDRSATTGQDPTAAVAMLSDRLGAAYAGRPWNSPVDRAFAETVERYAIPFAIPAALIEGMLWDVEGRRYETLCDLHAYAARVAGTVGAMMALVMGVRASGTLARACDLGVAMQLSNIARDVGEDAGLGRLYLPRSWMREEGLDPDAWLARPCASEALRTVVARLLSEAERLYARADAGIARLPFGCRPGIAAARRLYAGIGGEVAALGSAHFDRRAVVPQHRKATLLACALTQAILSTPWRNATAMTQPPLPAVRFLVDAAAQPDIQQPTTRHVAWWDLAGGTVAAIELFHRMGQADRSRRQGDARSGGGTTHPHVLSAELSAINGGRS